MFIQRTRDQTSGWIDHQTRRQARHAVGQGVAIHITESARSGNRDDRLVVCSCFRRQRCNRNGRIVGAGNGDGQRGGAGITIAVGDGVVKSFGEGFAHRQCLHDRLAVVERVAVGTVDAQCQGAIGAG